MGYGGGVRGGCTCTFTYVGIQQGQIVPYGDPCAPRRRQKRDLEGMGAGAHGVH